MCLLINLTFFNFPSVHYSISLQCCCWTVWLGLGLTISSLWRVPQFEFRAGAQTQRTILMARNTKSSPCFSINLQADRGDELKLCGWKRMLSTVVNSPFKLLCGPYKEIYTVNLHQNLADERGQQCKEEWFNVPWPLPFPFHWSELRVAFMLTECCSYLKRAEYVCMCFYTRKRWHWA